jgi:hypothetical protein
MVSVEDGNACEVFTNAVLLFSARLALNNIRIVMPDIP